MTGDLRRNAAGYTHKNLLIDSTMKLNASRLRSHDPEDNTDLVWSLAGTDADRFAISASGELTFKDDPDYENPADSGEEQCIQRDGACHGQRTEHGFGEGYGDG